MKRKMYSNRRRIIRINPELLSILGPVSYDDVMSKKCLRCFRPEQSCYCPYITEVNPGVKFVFLMHPEEAYKQKTGTGRLASLSLADSEIIIDSSFDNNKRTQELIDDPLFYPMVLYPGKDAHFAETFEFGQLATDHKLLIFLIDATWILARKMMYRSPSLQVLPKLSFSKEYRSRFLIKKQPQDYCLSTIESSYYLIEELKQAGVCDLRVNAEGLLNIFDRMIQFQLDRKKERLRSSGQKE